MKIIFRKAKKGDGKNWIKFLNKFTKTNHFKYQGDGRVKGRKEIHESNKSFSSDTSKFTFFAIDYDTHKIIGNCSARGNKGKERHLIEIGWNVDSNYVRQGIATKLVGEVIREAKKRGLKKIVAHVAVENKPSIELAKKLKFKIEGRIKRGMFLDNGRYVDVYLFGMLL